MSKGISETKDVIKFIASAISVIESRKGKASVVSMIPYLIKMTPKAIKAINGIREIPDEFKDLDDSERAELKKIIEKEIKTDNDKLELIVEKVLEVIVQLSQLLKFLKK